MNLHLQVGKFLLLIYFLIKVPNKRKPKYFHQDEKQKLKHNSQGNPPNADFIDPATGNRYNRKDKSLLEQVQ